jgi:nucleoid DNA-binding protein
MLSISAKLYYFILALLLTITPQPAEAKCLGYPWLTEMHAKELGISCKSAHKQILDISKTISKALSSDRDVLLPSIGEFKLVKGTKSNPNYRKISFRIDKILNALLNKVEK